MSRTTGWLALVALVALISCADREESRARKPDSPIAPAPALVEAEPATASTVCLAFQRDLVQVKDRLERSPADTDLLAGVKALDAIIADTCN